MNYSNIMTIRKHKCCTINEPQPWFLVKENGSVFKRMNFYKTSLRLHTNVRTTEFDPKLILINQLTSFFG